MNIFRRFERYQYNIVNL